MQFFAVLLNCDFASVRYGTVGKIKKQTKAQRSGFGLERRSDGMNER